ncbi:hypothetical protein [Pleurocapsa sp. FMAR1]|uniref:hypothetical protein n=1 Tax=Pleurocapsa sp. FMAR1 TaxID=3040204 RepID=UPI0029C87B1D|nr:hypothetical protein [Pleurocapsa sp. FMAR1]
MNMLRKLKTSRIVTAFLLGIFLMATTACTSKDVSKVSDKSDRSDLSNGIQKVGLLYSDSKKVKSLKSVDDFVSPETQRALLNPAQIPAQKQPSIDRADPDAKLLERIRQMFKDASSF